MLWCTVSHTNILFTLPRSISAVNGLVMILWVGLQFPAESVQKLFGVPSLAQLNTDTMVCQHSHLLMY